MKKLLLLGGSRYLLPIIKVAHELGLHVITCDYLPDNIAHKYSDEYYNVSIIQKDKVLELAQNINIDGIMSFACDPGVVTAAYVAEKLGLPSCGSYKSVCVLQNKGEFRKFLANNGFNVPKAKSYDNIADALNDVSYFNWPVIVKPIDSAGSKGVTKVNKHKDLQKAIEYALEFSHCARFIIEDFIEKKGCSSDTDSFSINGKLVATTFSSQRFDLKAKNPYAPIAYSWPSTFSKKHEMELTCEIQRLLTLLGMQSSVYNIETREGTDGKVYIMEVSPRGGGNRLAEMIRYASGVDMLKAAVQAAIGWPIDEIKQPEYNGCWAEYILHSRTAGRFIGLWIDDSVMNNSVVEIDLWVCKGEMIQSFSAANFAIGTVVLKFDTQEELEEKITNIDAYIKVIVE